MNNLTNFLSDERNKKRLLSLLKKNGEYLAFNSKYGYLYLLHIGEADGKAVYLEVALRNGDITILNTHRGSDLAAVRRIAQ